METHEEGWGQQPDHGTRMIAVMRIPRVSMLNVVRMYQASRVREDQSEESPGQTWELLLTSVQRNSLNTCRRWLFILCLNTHTHTHTLSLSLSHISVYITRLATMVPCEGAFHRVCHHDCISSCFPCATSFSSSVVSPPHCSICDLECVCCSSLL